MCMSIDKYFTMVNNDSLIEFNKFLGNIPKNFLPSFIYKPWFEFNPFAINIITSRCLRILQTLINATKNTGLSPFFWRFAKNSWKDDSNQCSNVTKMEFGVSENVGINHPWMKAVDTYIFEPFSEFLSKVDLCKLALSIPILMNEI